MMLSAAAAALRLEAAVASVPHPAKAQTGGEDAHLLLPAPRPGDHVVGAYGVFDGVGGWADEGIDAGLFSRSLAAHTTTALRAQSWADELDLIAALGAGLKATSEVGSSTACVLYLTREGVLRALNVGDSGYRVLSTAGPKLKARSHEQTHGFNFPYQLGTGSSDRPEHGDLSECRVDVGDLVLLASDGVFDNLDDAALCGVVGATDAGAAAGAVAEAVAAEARRLSVRLDWDSPFGLEAQRHGFWHRGGKLDDVTVVCVRVLPGVASKL